MLVLGVCANASDAEQACISFAQDHGYSAGYCHSGGVTIGGVNWSLWGAGNLCESNPGPGANNCGPWGTKSYLGNFYWLQYYVHADPQPQAQCGATCNGIGDPINPASGAVYDTIVDVPTTVDSVGFKRFYGSTDSGAADVSVGWRHSFSAAIRARYSSVIYRKYRNEPGYSSLYSSPSSACTDGFSWVKTRVANWQNATASYANGQCTLTLNGEIIGTLPLYAPELELSSAPPVVNAILGPSLLGFDVIRDDGQLITFWLQGGSAVAPPGVSLRLQQTGSGFLLIDSNDNVESYDVNGRLLSITSRAGLVQTMSYDAAGRLNAVIDSFGRQLTLSYDSQGRLASVVRQ